jgi:GTP-binding protein HflX
MPAAVHQVHTEEKEQVLLVFVNADASEDDMVEEELEGLVEAAEAEPAAWIRQRVERPLRASYLGSGKVLEVAALADELHVDAVVFDTELSGVQIKNLEAAVKRRVIDRSTLILDIFARRAKTREGQIQVELAQLTYRLPRLMSVYTKFERQRGGIGMRGPGEMKLEADRRMVRERIARLQHDLDGVRRHRQTQRRERQALPFPSVAIIGYTSAGKSTLMNRLAHTDLLADAMPFATLDPTTRRIELEDGFNFFLSDTVGFIRHLPTPLIAAFRATLEETVEADLHLHVVDASRTNWEDQRDVVLETIAGLGAEGAPCLTVFNKIDRVSSEDRTRMVAEMPDAVAVSSLTGEGFDELLRKLREMLSGRFRSVRALIPYSEAHLAEKAHDFGRVLVKDYRDEGIYLEGELAPEMAGRLEAYAVDAP